MFPNGAIATHETVLQQFPACLTFTHIVETDEAGEVMFALENLSAMKSFYNLDSSLSIEDAIIAVEHAANNPVADTPPGPEERIAAAMEFQNAMSL